MKILSQEDTDLLTTLANNEIVVIEKGFAISEFIGKVFLSNAINDFKNIHLKAKYGDIIPSMCTEYRLFIFKLLENIKNELRFVPMKNSKNSFNFDSPKVNLARLTHPYWSKEDLKECLVP